jgi:hypothetical protein
VIIKEPDYPGFPADQTEAKKFNSRLVAPTIFPYEPIIVLGEGLLLWKYRQFRPQRFGSNGFVSRHEKELHARYGNLQASERGVRQRIGRYVCISCSATGAHWSQLRRRSMRPMTTAEIQS